MEVVIAIGVVAFAIPLILVATSSVNTSRRDSEADTRSAWIAKHVQQQVIAKWMEPSVESEIESEFPFPQGASSQTTTVLGYDRDGNFLSEEASADLASPSAVPEAVFLASISAARHSDSTALVAITVQYPAKAAAENRSSFFYKFLTVRQGLP